MGGGFYDRTLQGWQQRHRLGVGPYPIGLAHDCQRVAALPVAAWDVPLPEIITPAGPLPLARRRRRLVQQTGPHGTGDLAHAL